MIENIPILPLLVAFLHELGHAMTCLVTGGHVLALQVNFDGSGLCTTSGGNRALIDCGGYLGSVLFGNIMLYVGIKHRHFSRILSGLIAVGMVLCSLIWFSTLSSFIITAVIGGVLLFLFTKVAWSGRWFLILAGTLSILYVIHDYRVGPSSDLEAFASVVGLTPLLWMYLWLGVAVIITAASLWMTLKGKKG
jgi:hypothetical protein